MLYNLSLVNKLQSYTETNMLGQSKMKLECSFGHKETSMYFNVSNTSLQFSLAI